MKYSRFVVPMALRINVEPGDILGFSISEISSNKITLSTSADLNNHDQTRLETAVIVGSMNASLVPGGSSIVRRIVGIKAILQEGE